MTTASDTLRIVAARDEHSPAVCALIQPIFEEYEGVIFDIDEMPELRAIATSFASAGGAFWCALRGERVVGTVGYAPCNKDGEGGVELKKLYVARSERGAGLGRQLLAQVEVAAAGRAARFVELWSDVKFVTAHRFYQRNGYARGAATRLLHDRSDTVEYYFRKPLCFDPPGP